MDSLISLSFMVSTFFNRAKLASMIGPVLVFGLVIPAYVFTFYPSYEFVAVRVSADVFCLFAYSSSGSLYSSNSLERDVATHW